MKQLKLIHRYILKEALLYLVICAFAFISLLLVLRILRFTNLIVNKGVALAQIAKVFLAIIPTFLEFAIPMATLLGVMMALARLSGDSEIVVMRSSGISLKQLLRPIFILGIGLSLVSFYMSLSLRPWGYSTLSSTLFDIARTRTIAGLDQGVFNKMGNITLYAENIDHMNGHMHNILIDDQRAEKRQIIISDFGILSSSASGAGINIALKDGSIHEVQNPNYTLTKFITNSFNIPPEEFYDPDTQNRSKRDRELSLSELADRKLLLKEKLKKIHEETDPEKAQRDYTRQLYEVRIERARRFTMPIAAFLFALLGMPLGIQAPRAQKTWGTSLSVALGMIVFIIYYAVLSVAITLAESGSLNPYLAVLLPNIVVGILAYLSLREMSKERWQSVTEPVEALLGRFNELLFSKTR